MIFQLLFIRNSLTILLFFILENWTKTLSTILKILDFDCSFVYVSSSGKENFRNGRKRWKKLEDSSIPVRDTCAPVRVLFSRVYFARPLRQINIHDSGGNYVRQLPTLRRWNIDGARPELGQIEMNDTSTYTYTCTNAGRAFELYQADRPMPAAHDPLIYIMSHEYVSLTWLAYRYLWLPE